MLALFFLIDSPRPVEIDQLLLVSFDRRLELCGLCFELKIPYEVRVRCVLGKDRSVLLSLRAVCQLLSERKGTQTTDLTPICPNPILALRSASCHSSIDDSAFRSSGIVYRFGSIALSGVDGYDSSSVFNVSDC